MKKWGLRLLKVLYVGLIACLPLTALANYTATQGAGTNVGSVIIAGVHFFSNLVCDFATANQCATVSAANALKVDGSAVTQPVSLTSTTITGSVAVTNAGTFATQLTGATNNINNIAGTISLPTGAATAANQGLLTTWAGGTLGAMANYGTSPGAVLVPGVNAFVTNALTSVNDNADGVAVATPYGSPVVPHNYGFNGSTWDRQYTLGNQIRVQVAQTVTAASAYASGNAVGGLITIAAAARVSGSLGASGTSGILQNVAVDSKSVQTAQMDIFIFDANPSGSTCTDKTAFVLATADFDKVIGVISVPSSVTNNNGWFSGGTGSVGQANNQAMAYALSSATSLFACMVTRGTPTFTATSDISLKFNMLRS